MTPLTPQDSLTPHDPYAPGGKCGGKCGRKSIITKIGKIEIPAQIQTVGG
jgi:hypothetical protein